MKRIKVGINGFGRIGRTIARVNREKNIFDIAAINDINPDTKNLAYLLKYDSTYGRFADNVGSDENTLIIGDRAIPVHCNPKVTDVPWEKHGVDTVIDASGDKSNLDAMIGYSGPVRQFIVTHAASGYDGVKTVIFGVNESSFNPGKHKIVSSSICDSVALSPLVRILTENHGIESGFLVTLHPWLSYQKLLDGKSIPISYPEDSLSHFALGRSSINSLIPKSTTAVQAASSVFPGLSDKIRSFSYRVPTNIVTGAVLTVMLDKSIRKSDLIARFEEAEKEQQWNVFKNSWDPLTSLDYLGSDYSIVMDHRWTRVENNRHVQIVFWYDNEWGYSSRVVDFLKLMASKKFVPE